MELYWTTLCIGSWSNKTRFGSFLSQIWWLFACASTIRSTRHVSQWLLETPCCYILWRKRNCSTLIIILITLINWYYIISFIRVFDLGSCPTPQYPNKTLLDPWVPFWCPRPRNVLNIQQRIHNAMDAVHWDVSRSWTNSIHSPWTPWVHHIMRLADDDPQWRWSVCGRRWWANHWQHQ